MPISASTINKLGALIGSQEAEYLVAQVDRDLLDNQVLYFGTGSDASITYDGTNWVFNSQVVGSGVYQLTGGNVQILGDSQKVLFGAGADASIYYDGTDMQFDSQEVGSGDFRFNNGQVLLDAMAVANADEGDVGRLTIQTAREVITLSAATTTTTLLIPSGAVLLGASLNVDEAVVDDGGDDTWSAAFVTGSTTALASGAAAAADTKVDTLVVPEVTTDVTEVDFTPNGGDFTAGIIEVVVYYYALTSLDDVAA